MNVQIKIVCNNFGACSGAMTQAVGQAFQTLGPQLLSTMQGKTPVDTGELKGSESSTVAAKTLTLRAGTDHCAFVEFGTRKMAAQPYMKPTMDGAAGQVGSAISAAASSAFGGVACS